MTKFFKSMTTIAVQWARGTIKLKVRLSQEIDSVIEELSKITGLRPDQMELYYDCKFTNRISRNISLVKAKIKNRTMLYMDVVNSAEIPSNVKFGEQLEKQDVGVDIMGDDVSPEEREAILARARAFGPRVVTTEMMNVRDRGIPHFGTKEMSSVFAIRIPQSKILDPFFRAAYQNGYKTHRVMFLFGRVEKYTGKVTVHCSLEPQQKNFVDHFQILEEFDMNLVRRIAQAFGMDCVGMAISCEKFDNDHPITEYMIKLAAKYQAEISEHFTTIIATANSAEAFQVNDAAVKSYQKDLFDQSTSPILLKFKEEVKLGTKRSKEFDVNFALCTLRIRPARSHFPDVENFPSLSEYPSINDVKGYLNSTPYCPWWYRLFNFRLLVYLFCMKIIPESKIKEVVDQIIAKEQISKSVITQIENLTR